MPNDRETIDLDLRDIEDFATTGSITGDFATTGSITINIPNDAASNFYNPVQTCYHCMICGESIKIDRLGYTSFICDECIDTIKFMKEVKKNIIKRKGKCNESKQPKE